MTGSSVAMGCGLAAGYGTLAVYAVRYLYPAGPRATAWVFVTTVDGLKAGESLDFVDPTGAKIVVARQKQTETDDDQRRAEDFVALSSVCPHLGCQVHWEPQNNRFYCPCHNGVFNPQGVATSGPPADGGQSLAHYPLKVDGGMLFIEVPVESLRGSKEA